MHLIEIDVTGAEGPEARGAGVADEPADGLPQPAFRGDDDRVSATADPIAQRRVEPPCECAEAVRLRGIKEVDAEVAGTSNGRRLLRLIDAPPVSAGLP